MAASRPPSPVDMVSAGMAAVGTDSVGASRSNIRPEKTASTAAVMTAARPSNRQRNPPATESRVPARRRPTSRTASIVAGSIKVIKIRSPARPTGSLSVSIFST